MRTRFRTALLVIVNRLSDNRLIASWVLYMAGLLLSHAMYYPPMARPVSVDTNDLSPGAVLTRITYSYSKFGATGEEHGAWTQRSVSPQRGDNSLRVLIMAIESNDRGHNSSVASEVASAMLQLNPVYLSKEVVIVRVKDALAAQAFASSYALRHSERTLAAIVLLADPFLTTDVLIDVRGPGVARPNLDMVSSLLHNCDVHGVKCQLVPDTLPLETARSVHWVLNDHGVDALTLVVRATERRPDGSQRTERKAYEMLVQSHCRLLEAQIRSLNNLMEPLHDASFLYLVSPISAGRSGEQTGPLFVLPVQMTMGFACFPAALLVSSVQLICSPGESSLSFAAKSLFLGHFLLPWLAKLALPQWVMAVSSYRQLAMALYMLAVFLSLDLALVGQWPRDMSDYLCQLCALYLCGLAVDNYLVALQTSYCLVPFVISLHWLGRDAAASPVPLAVLACAALTAHYRLVNAPSSRRGPHCLLISGLITHCLLWVARQ